MRTATQIRGTNAQHRWVGTNPFVIYRSQTNFINVKIVPYEHKNSSWNPISREIIKTKNIITPTFNYQNVKFDMFEQQSNLSRTSILTSHVDIMNNIIATMAEHGAWDQTTFVQSPIKNLILTKAFSLTKQSFFGNFWFYQFYQSFMTVVSITIICIVLRIFYCIALHILIYQLCCKKKGRIP